MHHLSFIYSLVLCALLGSAGFTQASEIHQWRDANGNVHFGDNPPEGVKTKSVTVEPNIYATPSVEKLEQVFEDSNSDQVSNKQANTRGKKVVMYSAVWCGYCNKARKYFQANNIPFQEYDVETSKKGQRDYKRLGARGVPVILVGKQRMNGFSKTTFDKLYRSS